jgi:hypothetical protein
VYAILLIVRNMSECLNIEHPFLEKLHGIGWQVSGKGEGGSEALEKYEEIYKELMDRMLN